MRGMSCMPERVVCHSREVASTRVCSAGRHRPASASSLADPIVLLIPFKSSAPPKGKHLEEQLDGQRGVMGGSRARDGKMPRGHDCDLPSPSSAICRRGAT